VRGLATPPHPSRRRLPAQVRNRGAEEAEQHRALLAASEQATQAARSARVRGVRGHTSPGLCTGSLGDAATWKLLMRLAPLHAALRPSAAR
jgi:hypothetical protein